MSFALMNVGGIVGLTTAIGLTSLFTVPTNSVNIFDAKGTLYAQTVIADSATSWESSLQGSTWTGTYQVEAKTHTTTLEIKSVDAGFIGGIVTHKNSDGAYLQVKVAGDISTQYLVDFNNDGKTEWLDEDRLTPEKLGQLTVKEKRLILRLKRFRALEIKSGSNNTKWSPNREYRLRLVDGKLSGSVGIPPEAYGDGSSIQEEGSMTLQRQRTSN